MYSLLGKERGSCSSLKGELGATTILVVSIAACKVGATKKKVPLYKHITDLSGKTNPTLLIPAFTVISGGKHVGSTMAIQKIMVLPIGASKFEEGLRRNCGLTMD